MIFSGNKPLPASSVHDQLSANTFPRQAGTAHNKSLGGYQSQWVHPQVFGLFGQMNQLAVSKTTPFNPRNDAFRQPTPTNAASSCAACPPASLPESRNRQKHNNTHTKDIISRAHRELYNVDDWHRPVRCNAVLVRIVHELHVRRAPISLRIKPPGKVARRRGKGVVSACYLGSGSRKKRRGSWGELSARSIVTRFGRTYDAFVAAKGRIHEADGPSFTRCSPYVRPAGLQPPAKTWEQNRKNKKNILIVVF